MNASYPVLSGQSDKEPAQSDQELSRLNQNDERVIPGVDPSDAESRGKAPVGVKEHVVWSLKSDTMILIYKMMFTLVVGMSLYWIATIHIYIFFALSVVLPIILLLINTFIYRELFIPEFESATILVRIKYCTFVTQNLVLFIAYKWSTDAVLAETMTWVLRLNILEVGIATGVQRLYVYWIPSICLLLPIFGWYTVGNNFPRLGIVADDHYLAVWEDWDPWFLVIYTGWFIGWIVRTTEERVPYVMHTLFPLFAPPELWFSVRTFTGMFLLWWLYLKPIQKWVTAAESKPQVADFSEIYDAIYVMVFCGAWIMPFLREYLGFAKSDCV